MTVVVVAMVGVASVACKAVDTAIGNDESDCDVDWVVEEVCNCAHGVVCCDGLIECECEVTCVCVWTWT